MSVESVIMEIRAAEGGADARQLVLTQLGIYAAFAHRSGL